MAQWSYPMPPVPTAKPPMPMPIPEEWQKANEALQAVKQPKSGSNENSPTKQEQSTVNDFPNNYEWQNSFTAYPGFPGYAANYGYYNFNYNHYLLGTSQLYMNQLAASHQPVTPLPSTSASAINNSESQLGETKPNIATALVHQPPPPPPPPPASPPSSVNGPTFYTDISSKQAPGAGGIKFQLPKKKNKAFPKGQGILQNRTNNFQSYGESSSPSSNENLQDNILHQKSVSSMAKDKWPPSLKNYVNECFKKCKNDIDKDQIEIILKGKLLRAYNDGSIFTKDWTAEPLPNIHSERVEMEQKMAAAATTLRNQPSRTSSPPSLSKSNGNHRTRNYRSRSRSRSRSYSRSRSRSRTPPRRVVKKKRHSSTSSESSDDSRGSRKTLSSSVTGPKEFRNQKNNYTNKNKKNKKKKGNNNNSSSSSSNNNMSFIVDPEYSTDERLQKRAARFEVKGNNKKRQSNNLVFTISNLFTIDKTGCFDETGDIEWGSDAIIGTCVDLEKPFLRLTGAVDPSTVRPEEVLVKSLNMVKKHWLENHDYHFACEQLKSIRQDLVVQCIRNKFTVQVYETHARIALEKGDHTEFNQCQSQLKALYEEVGEGNRLEFTGYHILYTMYTENTLEMKNILTDLSAEDKLDEVVSHALKLAKAWSNNNYDRFFKLYLSSPKMSSFIIDWFVERIRKSALKAIIKSFRPNIPVSHIQSALAFPSAEDCMAFLTKANLIFGDSGVINCKESMAPLANF